MKIICINNHSAHGFLTINKIYETFQNKSITPYNLQTKNSLYEIIDDIGNISRYSKKRFLTIKQYRKLKLKTLKL